MQRTTPSHQLAPAETAAATRSLLRQTGLFSNVAIPVARGRVVAQAAWGGYMKADVSDCHLGRPPEPRGAVDRPPDLSVACRVDGANEANTAFCGRAEGCGHCDPRQSALLVGGETLPTWPGLGGTRCGAAGCWNRCGSKSGWGGMIGAFGPSAKRRVECILVGSEGGARI